MIRNSPNGFLFPLRRIRDTVVGLSADDSGWPVMCNSDCGGEAADVERDKVDEPELDMWELYPPLMFLVVGMSKGDR
jgi:hypothetical protein